MIRLISNEIYFGKKGFKCFIDYKDNENSKLLCRMLSKMSEYTKRLKVTKYMSFLIKDDELLETYGKIWNKVRIVLKKDLIVNQYNKKYLKTKIKSYSGKVSINFHDDSIQKKVLIAFLYQ